MTLPNPLDLLIAPAFAQAAGQQGPSLMSTLAFPVILLLIMYFLMIRPQMKRAKEHKAMLEKLSVGDEVITNGGLAGTVRAIGDSFLTVEIADRIEVRVQKGAVGNVLPKGTLKSA
ncbi:MAG: preprotein translocase subunit YajC [Pseudomonadota bacterium]|nr:preprotein translocase subunit YajC [Pseudomonadota bacterium]